MIAAQISIAADGAEHLAKLVRAMPSHREGGDGAGTGPANGPVFWLAGEIEFFSELRKEFIDDDARVFIIERVVLLRPV